MAKNIKNIKVSYPDEYTDKLWLELYARRDKMLRLSDWVLLEDSNLTVESLELWKTWRNSIRLLTKENFPILTKANSMLHTIKGAAPNSVFNKTLVKQEYITENDMNKTSRLEKQVQQLIEDVSNMADALIQIRESENSHMRKQESDMVNEIIREYKLAKPTPPEKPMKQLLPTNLDEAKSVLTALVKSWYRKAFDELTDVPMPILVERCEQAIDYKLSNNLNAVPLIEKYSQITGLPASKVADNFIEDKKELMSFIGGIDAERWSMDNLIVKCTDVNELEELKTKINLA